jgi:Putative MetA-pathway of phenol degradation
MSIHRPNSMTHRLRAPASLLPFFAILALSSVCSGQERPYFVTYSAEMEEPGNLEIATKSAIGKPHFGNRFLGSSMEFEYGAKAWWTTEFYLDGVSVAQDSTIFTGFRWENRFRPLAREHWINPVLYVEFENINGADKSLLEVVGHDRAADLVDSNANARQEKARELELKLILGSNFKGWNLSENLIFEKNLDNSPWEFGYAIGASRPVQLTASAKRRAFCAQRFAAGVEMYGGLGDRYTPGLHETSHYLGPAVNWSSPSGVTLSFSPQFGLNDSSVARLYRFGVSYEISQVFGKLSSFLHRHEEGR